MASPAPDAWLRELARVTGREEQAEAYIAREHARVKPDFIIIRHNGLAPLAARLGIPAVPLGDEHHALGYQGMVNLGESILALLQHRKFHQDIASRVTLPYKKSWLAQQDPFYLARTAQG
jgi:nitrogenase molybdenum-iron protein alpha chain